MESQEVIGSTRLEFIVAKRSACAKIGHVKSAGADIGRDGKRNILTIRKQVTRVKQFVFAADGGRRQAKKVEQIDVDEFVSEGFGDEGEIEFAFIFPPMLRPRCAALMFINAVGSTMQYVCMVNGLPGCMSACSG